jgi:hypothetical protein
MITGLLITLTAVLSQQPASFYGAVPEDVPTYVITLPEGDQVHAGLRMRDTWVTDRAPVFDSGLRPTIVEDTPWNPKQEYQAPFRKVTYGYETATFRKERLTAGWEKAGYVFVKTAAGEVPVLEQELELAKRAQEMATPTVPEGESQAVLASMTGDTPTASSATPSWLGHVLIVLAGLVLAGVVIKLMVMNDQWKKI